MRPKLNEKDLLNASEAIELFGLSNRKFRALLASEHSLPFQVGYNSRKLIIRQEFERYLQRQGSKEALLNGRR